MSVSHLLVYVDVNIDEYFIT